MAKPNNPDTLVSVHGYAGDAHQVRFMMPYFLHHDCPVVVMSPEDSPITEVQVGKKAGVTYETGGKRAYIGQLSLDRQIIHMQMLLKHPQKFFLMNDADSVCLSPQLPQYLYDEPEVMWSQVVSDAMHIRPDPNYPWPRLAFQPPYFCSRGVLEKLLTVASDIKAEPQTPFIDWCMMAWAVAAQVPFKSFPDGISCATERNPQGTYWMSGGIQHNGVIFLHSIKSLPVLIEMAHSRLRYKRKKGIK